MDTALTVGLIDGGGTGAELLTCVKRLLSAVSDVTKHDFSIVEFDNKRWQSQFDEERYDSDLHADLLDFYNAIQQRAGVIVRGSLPAPVLYKLRRDVEQAVKVVPLNPFPSVSRYPEFRTTLIRESIHGIYHHDQMSREGDIVRAQFEWTKKTFDFLASQAFRLAEAHAPHRVTTVLKTSVLGEMGALWLDAFKEESLLHPTVQYSHRPSGAGFSDMWMAPNEYGIVVTDDQSGDILADLVPTILYESRNLVSAGNLSMRGHASFQTDHGTIKPLVGMDAVNPLAMIGALGMALEHGLGEDGPGRRIFLAVEEVLTQGYRTSDFHSQAAQKLVGTTEMTDLIIERVQVHLTQTP
jgi:isocitrate/isopropylmalate dehydrogenase